ncbi:hypothetical protein AN75_02919, partial [Mycobacterium tuberculosis M1295]
RQTQNPERGRKLDTDMTAVPHLTQSSDPKPREGTETRMVGKLALGSESSRQTQNPERGRKPASGKSVRSKRFQRVVRPKTPRGDGNSKSSTTSAAAACSRSRQTQNPERGRKLNNTFFERGAVESVVRPKTPRGDGNPYRGRRRCERTRRVVRPKTPRGDGNNTSVARHTPTNHQVVRPKTPRGDGNFSDHLCGISGLRSSDPKPREGTETPMRRHFRLQFQPVVRPKTPRGDGNLRRASTRGCRLRWSSDPKPREGTETRR